jgi:hypothetical protein
MAVSWRVANHFTLRPDRGEGLKELSPGTEYVCQAERAGSVISDPARSDRISFIVSGQHESAQVREQLRYEDTLAVFVSSAPGAFPGGKTPFVCNPAPLKRRV